MPKCHHMHTTVLIICPLIPQKTTAQMLSIGDIRQGGPKKPDCFLKVAYVGIE